MMQTTIEELCIESSETVDFRIPIGKCRKIYTASYRKELAGKVNSYLSNVRDFKLRNADISLNWWYIYLI